MKSRIKADIEPSILSWARKRYSTTYEIVSLKTNIREEQIRNFEEGSDKPSFAQLRRIAIFFKLSITVFFLPYPPGSEKRVTASLRRLSGMSIDGFSLELTRSIIDSIEKREFFIEINDFNQISNWPFEEETKYSPIIARELLGIDIETQRAWKDTRIAFNNIRSLLESINILVFQISGIDISEFRACAITEFPCPVIIVNRSDSYAGRTFSLIHELFHLINKQYDVEISNEKRIIPPEYIDIEQEANQFASFFLLPENVFNLELSKRWRSNPDQFIDSVSKQYSISKEFVARRLLDKQYIDKSKYYKVRDEGISNTKKKSGFVPPNIDSLSKNGKLFSSAIFHEITNGNLSRSKACNYLDVKEKWLDTILRAL